jgi:transcriptional regulator with XRE-family HTH domain
MDEGMPVGQRIRYWRRRRGLSQEVLAGLVGRSKSWLTKVERGERVLDSISVLLKMADELRVEPGDLIGEFRLPPNGGAHLNPPRGVPAIRRALFMPLHDQDVPDVGELRASVERAILLDGAGSYEALALVLPELLTASRVAASRELPGAWWCLAGAYQAVAGLAHTLRVLDLQLTCADRAIAAAERSADPLMVAVSRRWLANALMRQGLLDDAGAVCSDAADVIAPGEATSRAGWSVWGSLQLVAADAAVRSGDAAGAWRLLRDARVAAERVGSGHNDYWQAFGSASVAANETGVAWESGDPIAALQIAERVDVQALPTKWRRARFLLDVAHAHGLREDDVATVGALLEAERHSPQVVRYRFEAHELVRVCLSREKRSRTPGLRGLAERMGVLN